MTRCVCKRVIDEEFIVVDEEYNENFGCLGVLQSSLAIAILEKGYHLVNFTDFINAHNQSIDGASMEFAVKIEYCPFCGRRLYSSDYEKL